MADCTLSVSAGSASRSSSLAMGDVMRDLFGKIQPDEFSRSIPLERPMMPDKTNRANSPHAMPRDREIEIRDNARLLCKAGRPDDKGVAYLEGSQIKRNGGAPAGSSSPGRNALLGWGEVAPVKGLLQMQLDLEAMPERKKIPVYNFTTFEGIASIEIKDKTVTAKVKRDEGGTISATISRGEFDALTIQLRGRTEDLDEYAVWNDKVAMPVWKLKNVTDWYFENYY